MSVDKRLRFSIAAGLLVIISLTAVFQNCSSAFQLGQSLITPDHPLGIDHPAPDQKSVAGQKVLVAPKSYVADLMRDIFTSTTAPAPIAEFAPGGLSLKQGDTLNIGSYVLAMQTDGNAVLYDANSKPVYYTSTNGQCTSCQLVFQSDGNLVVYDTSGPTPKPLFFSATYPGSAAGQGAKLRFYDGSPFLGIADAGGTLIYPSTFATVAGLNDLIEQWILFKPSQYGGSCNTYDTYAGGDCGGDVTNASLPSLTDDSSLRESFRLQFCQSLLAQDAAVAAALEKINQRPTDAPTRNSVTQTYSLFYRGDDPETDAIDALMTLDTSLKTSVESPLERWRAILLTICQSPGWQLL